MKITKFKRVEGIWQLTFTHEGITQEVWSKSTARAISMAIVNAHAPLTKELPRMQEAS